MKKGLMCLMLSLLFLTGCSSTEKAEEKKENITYAIQETAVAEDLELTVNGVREVSGNDFSKPKSGKKWIAIEMTIANTGESTQPISSLLSISLKDDDGREQDYNIMGELNGNLDGEILAGEKMTGEVGFEVDENSDALTLYYKTGLVNSETIKFKIQ